MIIAYAPFKRALAGESQMKQRIPIQMRYPLTLIPLSSRDFSSSTNGNKNSLTFCGFFVPHHIEITIGRMLGISYARERKIIHITLDFAMIMDA